MKEILKDIWSGIIVGMNAPSLWSPYWKCCGKRDCICDYNYYNNK